MGVSGRRGEWGRKVRVDGGFEFMLKKLYLE
jgi:hypothetical protein